MRRGVKMEMNESVRKNLIIIRQIEGSSIVEFAAKIDVSRTTLQNIEAGKANLTLDMVESIAKRLGISPLVLLSDEYDEEQIRIVKVLLDNLKWMKRLTREEQTEVLRHFNSLVRILSKGEGYASED